MNYNSDGKMNLKVFHVTLKPAKTPTDTNADMGCEIVCLGESSEWILDELFRGRKGLPRTKETLDRITITEITGPFKNGFVLAFREGLPRPQGTTKPQVRKI